MDFDRPAETNIFDRARIIGKPHTRIDGPLKVSGQAPYAHERHDVVEGQLIGYPIGATIAKGRVVSIDADRARNADGVHAVVTTLDIKPLDISDFNHARIFGGDDIMHYHQAIAVVVADTFEQARAAAGLVTAEYEAVKADYDLEAAFRERLGTGSPDTVGDFDTGFANAPVKLDEIYRTPSHTHAMIEPHASVVDWSDGGELRIWTSNQMIEWGRRTLGKILGIDAAKVYIESPFVGGGFGGKLWIAADAVLAAIGSRATGRPVKVALPRAFIANNTFHRARTIQRIQIGADRDGRILAIGHESASHTLPGGNGENPTAQTPSFYAGEHRRIIHHAVEMNLPEANAMRAPGEASGLMALEVAMDEMAEKLGIDPVEFRKINDTQVKPGEPDRPFSDRHFVECLDRGAEVFGWTARNPKPATQREGHWLIGHGVAGAYRGAPTVKSRARVRLKDGRLTVETDMTDIGTGSYTIIAQTAAETMGLTMDDVEVRLGRSGYPVSAGSGGQFGAVSVTGGVYAACVLLRQQIADRLGVEDPLFEEGSVISGQDQTRLADVAPGEEFVAEDAIRFGPFKKKQVHATFGAHFVEVGVHVGTGETRIRRIVTVCDAGRILNPLTARSQIIGGVVMGAGSALAEDLVLDSGRGLFINHDLASYEVPVHADIPHQEMIFLETLDVHASPMKAKGVGELGVCGVAAAIANAAYNATGIRVRDYPITLERMIDRLPQIGT